MAGIHHENLGGLFHCHVRTAVAHGTPPSSDVHGGICLMYTHPISSHTQISAYIPLHPVISHCISNPSGCLGHPIVVAEESSKTCRSETLPKSWVFLNCWIFHVPKHR